MANQNFTLSNEEKIALLEELHRPLEGLCLLNHIIDYRYGISM